MSEVKPPVRVPSAPGSCPDGPDPSVPVAAATAIPSRVACRMCRERGKTWEGSNPTCSFPTGGTFSAEGWNCATTNALRELCGSEWEEQRPQGIYRERDEDQSVGLISLVEVELEQDYPRSLWMSWYKNRGRTEAMWVLSAEEPPRLPTEDDCLRILEAYCYRQAASAIEAHRAETGTGSVEDESATRRGTP